MPRSSRSLADMVGIAVIVLVAGAWGCASLKITNPPKGATGLQNPQNFTVATTGTLGPMSMTVDGRDTLHINGQNWSLVNNNMFFLDPGSHSISASAQDSGGNNYSDSCTFEIAAGGCPICYPPPGAGTYVHPFLGQVCSGNSCDFRAYANFGESFYSQCVGSQANDCINQNAGALCGSAGGNNCAGNSTGVTQLLAVQWQSPFAGVLAHIRVPLGHRLGTNSYELWVMTDNGGQPGTVLEHMTLTNIRAWTLPTVAPMHIYSVARPAMTANTKYWLLIGPGASDTVGSWNDAPFDAPTGGNLLANQTPGSNGVPGNSGPWVNTSTVPLRPAFQIDLH